MFSCSLASSDIREGSQGGSNTMLTVTAWTPCTIETAFSTQGTAGETGTGLGLVLCRQLVEQNGGSVRVASQAGRGTTFAVRLPKAG